MTVAALGIELRGDPHRVGVGLDHGPEHWVEPSDAIEIALGELAAREPASAHQPLELRHVGLDPWFIRRAERGRTGRGRGGRTQAAAGDERDARGTELDESTPVEGTVHVVLAFIQLEIARP